MSDDNIRHINIFTDDNLILKDKDNRKFYAGLYFTDTAIYSFLEINVVFKVKEHEKILFTDELMLQISSNMGLIFYHLAHENKDMVKDSLMSIQRILLVIRPSYLTDTVDKVKKPGKLYNLDDYRKD